MRSSKKEPKSFRMHFLIRIVSSAMEQKFAVKNQSHLQSIMGSPLSAGTLIMECFQQVNYCHKEKVLVEEKQKTVVAKPFAWYA